MNGTVKQLKDALETMRKVYPYNDEKTMFKMSGSDICMCDTVATLSTIDEATGVGIQLSKEIIEYDRTI